MTVKMQNESNIALLDIETIGEMVVYFKPIAMKVNRRMFSDWFESELKILDSINNILFVISQLNKINMNSKMLSTFLYLRDRVQVELEDAQEFIFDLKEKKVKQDNLTPQRRMQPKFEIE